MRTLTLVEKTRQLAKESGLSSREVAAIAQRTPQWAVLFLYGEIKDPSADCIQRLYEALTGNTLLKNQGDNGES